jgi:hypothetical protein
MADDYPSYLDRFERTVGKAEVGGYGKFEGKLVKKLSSLEFDAKAKEYAELKANYDKIVENGYTISNVLVRVLRERAAELLVEPPKI